MSETRPSISTLRDVGYKVIMKNEDGTPRKVWRCLVKEGNYGKFISVEQHWVRRMEGNKIVESDWARKSINFPHDREKAFATWNSIKELLNTAFGSGTAPEREVVEEFSDELEGLDEEDL
ncbi:MAG: hypothetical protein WAV32_01155 [Halobacteriota archaeon]